MSLIDWIREGSEEINKIRRFEDMATSGNKPFLKRGLEKELGIPRKKLKIDETVLCENQSD